MDLNLNLEDVKFLWGVLVTLVVAITAVGAWWGKRSRVTNDDIDAVRDDLRKVSGRLTCVEQSLEHIPTRQDIEGLRAQMSAIQASVAGINGQFTGELQGIRAQLTLINQHLLAGGRHP